MLGRGPSRGGCGLTPSASVQRPYLRTTPAAATGCLPLLVQGGEPFSSMQVPPQHGAALLKSLLLDGWRGATAVAERRGKGGRKPP